MINRFALSFLCIELDRNEIYEVMLVYILLRGYTGQVDITLWHDHLRACSTVLLSICFNACMVHGFLPSTMTDSILVPIIKDKTGNASSKANYRPIALTSVGPTV